MKFIFKVFPLFLFLTFISFWLACKDTNSGQTVENPLGETSVKDSASIDKKDITIYTWVNRLRMRESANRNSKVVEELPEGTALTFLNEKSDFTEKINLRGQVFDEPWLKVKTGKGNVGWVYGGGVKFYAPRVDTAPSPYDACMKLIMERKGEKVQDCIDKIKTKQMSREMRWVQEINNGLSLRLLDASKITIANSGNGVEYKNFEYRYYIKKMGYHVLRVFGHEWSAYELVNDKSGKRTEIIGYPKASPDQKHLISTNADLEAGFEFNGIQLWGFTENGFELLFEKEMEDYEPYLPIWIDPRTVDITLLPAPHSRDRRKKVLTLNLSDSGEWRLSDLD